MKEVSCTVELATVTITACAGIISCHPNAVLSVSPVHPHDLTNVKRWPRLPFYDDRHLYIRWKAKAFLQMNASNLACGEILVAATQRPYWEASIPPVVVVSSVPGADFKFKQGGYLPYQNPRLTINAAGNLNVLQDHMKQEAAGQKRKVAADTKEAEFAESYKQWERNDYKVGKEVTRRTNGTKERREMNFARFGYSLLALD